MATAEDRSNVMGMIGHNRSMAERRADIEEIITQHMLHARDAEFMSIQQIRDLSDVERLGAYQNNQLAAAIKSCRENPLRDTYHVVMLIIYAMGDLRDRVCMLSASQIAEILGRKERSIRGVLAKLVEDGYILKGDPTGRYGIVPHYPALRKALSDPGKVNPTWIMDGFAPGTIGRHSEPKTSTETTPSTDPCMNLHGSGDDPCTNLHGDTNDPCTILQGEGVDPCTITTLTPARSQQPPLHDLAYRVTIENNYKGSSSEVSGSPSAPAVDESQIDIEEVIEDANRRLVEVLDLEPVDGEVLQPGKTAKPKSAKRKTAQSDFPENAYWQQADLEYGVDQGLAPEQVRKEFLNFRDHHAAKGNRFANWRAAWQKWCRNAVDFGKSKSAPRGGRLRSSLDDLASDAFN